MGGFLFALALAFGPNASRASFGLQTFHGTDADSVRKTIVAKAESLRGKAYRWNANGPDAFDCSGFVWFVLRTVIGTKFNLPYELHGDPRPQSVYYRDYLVNQGATEACQNATPGDIVYFPASAGYHNHIGLITDPSRGIFITAQDKQVGVRDGGYGPTGYWSQRSPQCFRNIWVSR